jgi:type I restriction enzyme S subunit
LNNERSLIIFQKETFNLIANDPRSCRYLQERRTALISAAVTGKIDVRDWQPPSDPPSPPDSV